VAENKVGVVLVGHQETDRNSLRHMIDRDGELAVIGEAGTVVQGVAEALRLRADVTVISLHLPDGSAADACHQIRAQDPASHLVVLTSQADEAAIYPALMAGSAGYIRRDLDAPALHDALLVIAEGGSLLDPLMTTTMLQRLRDDHPWRPTDDRFATLTPREDQILAMLGAGLTNRGIAEQLSLSEGTIRNYVSRIYSRLHVERRSQAATLVTERRVRREQV
jgi:two-component system, NarL family, response regulator DevR